MASGSQFSLTLPITIPLVLATGFDKIWFDVFVVIIIEMAQITPPVGFNLFVIQDVTRESISRIALATFTFFLMLVAPAMLFTLSRKSRPVATGHRVDRVATGVATRRRFTKRRHAMVDQRGWRGKIGVAVPATNTMVQPDFDDLRPDGVTNHVSRIAVPNMAIENDADFDRLIRICESELDGAVDRVMSVAPDILVIGISSLLVWDGLAASEKRRDSLSRRTGLPVTGGSFAIAEALRHAGQTRVAVISPYPQIANDHITRFFADSGLEVTGFVGLHAPNPLAIADITAAQLTAALDAVDSDAADALIQFGTNMSFQRQAPIEETKRGKPVHAINAATYQHALSLLPVPMVPTGG